MEGVIYSGIGKRLFALFLDYFIVSLIGALLFFVSKTYVVQTLDEGSLFSFINVTALFYFILLESSFLQGTLGKTIMKIKVVNSDGNRLSLFNSVGRFFGKLLSVLTLGIGFFMMLFTKNKQSLHDKLANTYVVQIENFEELIEGGPQKISFMLLKYTGYALFSLLFLVLLMSLVDSVINSQFVKDVGNFMALVLGGIIWAAIFYGVYKIFKATGGDGGYLVSKILANLLGDYRKQDYKVKHKGDQVSSTHPTKEKAINNTKSAKNECYIYYKDTLLGVWHKGQFVRDK